MTHPTEPDLGPLTWVKPEIDLALARADESLEQALTAPDAPARVQFAQTHLHQTRGALSIVGLDGLTQFAASLDQTLGLLARGERPIDPPTIALARRALATIGNYLEELVHGTPDVPLRLLSLYREIGELRGPEPVAAVDLFFPDLSLRPPRRATPAAELPEDARQQQLRAQRALFQRGLLQWLRSPADADGPRAMREAVAGIEALHVGTPVGALWYAAQAFLECLAHGDLPARPEVKRLCSQLDAQLKRLSEVPAAVPERLIRELLYWTAQAPARTEVQRSARAIWHLDALIPEDGATVSATPLAPLLKSLQTLIAAAKHAWDGFSNGQAVELPRFESQLAELAEQAPQLGRPALDRLLRGVRAFAQWLRKDPLRADDQIALEVATALLLAEAALGRGAPDAGFSAQAADTVARLEALMRGEAVQPAGTSPTVETARRAQEREALGQVSREILSSLAQVEQILDDFFRNQQKRAPLEGLAKPLKQIEGALALVGDGAAIALVHDAAAAVARFSDPAQQAEPQEFERLAQRLSALGFYVEALQHGPADLERFLDPQAAALRRRRAEEAAALALAAAQAPEAEPKAAAQPVPPAQATSTAEAMPGVATPEARVEPAQEPAEAPAPQLEPATGTVSEPPPPVEARAVEIVAAPEAGPETAAPSPAPAPSAPVAADVDAELLGIFIEEAHDVLATIAELLGASRGDPANVEHLVGIRRGFHTLKGSGRMVGLRDLGEAAWGLEQTLNRWLQHEWTPTPALHALIETAHRSFAEWVRTLESGGLRAPDVAALMAEAERLRSLESPAAEAALPAPESVAMAEAPTEAETVAETAAEAAAEVAPEVPLEVPLEVPPEVPLEIAAEVAPEIPETPLDVVAEFAPEATATEFEHAEFALPEEVGAPVDAFDGAELLPEDTASEEISLDALEPEARFAEAAHAPGEGPRAAADVEEPLVEEPLVEESVVEESLAAPPVVAEGPAEPALVEAEVPGTSIEPGTTDEPLAGIELESSVFDFGDLPTPAEPAPPPPLHFDFEGIDLELPDLSEEAAETGAEPLPATPVDELDEFDEAARVVEALAALEPTDAFGALEATETSATEALEALEPPLEALEAPAPTEAREAMAGAAAEAFEVVEPLEEPVAPEPAEHAEAGAFLPDLVRVGPVEISRPLFDLYLGESRHHLGVLHAELSRLAANPTLVPAEPALRAVHTLAGISGTTRLMPLHELARGIEHALERLRESDQVPSADQTAVLKTAHDTLEAMLVEVCAYQMPIPVPVLVEQLDAVGREIALEAEFPAAPAPLPAGADARAAGAEPAPSRVEQAPTVHDDLDAQLMPIFLEEGAELLGELHSTLRSWRGAGHDDAAAKAVARLLHTLKGSARMAGAMTLGQHVHQLESRLIAAQEAGREPAELIEELVAGLDLAEQMIDSIATGGELPAVPAPEIEETAAAVPAPATATAAPEPDTGAGAATTLRVRADTVDRFVNQAGEIGIARTRIAGELRTLRRSLLDLTENVIRLRNQLREVEIQADVQMQSRIAHSGAHDGEFDPLEMDRYTRLQELTRMMAESVGDVTTVQQSLLRNLDTAELALNGQARLSRDLQQALMQVRMVPFDSLADRLYRVVRQTAKELGKRANLDLRGGRIEIDRSVLEHMTAPLEHLLRNAIAHGLETPEARRATGKGEIGQITLSVSQEGNEIAIVLADDGGGLDYARIAERARASGLLAPDEVADERRLTNLIFIPGFSTASNLSTVSGRGVGMDVVKAETAAVGGRIDIHAAAGRGTEFRIYLPLTLAVTQALLIRAGGRTYAIPSSMIAQVLELKADALEAVRRDGGTEWQEQRFAYRYLPQLLGDHASQPELQRFNWVLLLRAGAQTLALHVDALRGNQEIVVKNAGPQLARIVGISGATVLGDGEIVLILNPVALASRSLAGARELGSGTDEHVEALEPLEPFEAAPARTPTVMVVDDSLTVRKITGRLLEREGYRVVTAKDGVDALERLLDSVPDVILSDIEMPRMDGFDLLRNLRADDRTRDVPVIMITSRLADKHRQYAEKMGANHYLGKPYEEEELLGLLRQYTRHAQAA